MGAQITMESGYLGHILAMVLKSYMIAHKRNQSCASVSHLKAGTLLAPTSESIGKAGTHCLAVCTFLSVI